ncbi:SAM-dependent DNA methyltransferase [Cryobacterium sp. Hh11]|uniref:N-6 DNA methylase n=1 Tax=Cryobacterium sp. Hh11 TaxID=2555868 RepID=UPI001069135E|nr:N-6 DNA methylase [Cryobacterium sp. Hh11]TFD47591.1 SAM-dependent DNA methyltransferase [Cryobacterium sp. Hh11]
MKKLLEANVTYGRRRIAQVFGDFCELAALAIRNTVDPNGHAEREERYMRIIGEYSPEEAARFGEILAKLTEQLGGDLSDVLGQLYMSLELGSDDMGQYFTPFDISRMIAQMTCTGFEEVLTEQAFITVSEPTCGSGGMIVALADAMRAAGFNYQTQLHVTAQDLERTSVHMTYIALSLLHIPAVVIHGNTLTVEVLDSWYTPAHILGGWSRRLRNREALRDVAALTVTRVELVAPPVTEPPAIAVDLGANIPLFDFDFA